MPSGEKGGSWRDGALFTVAFAQSLAYEFADAKKTMQLIKDPQTLSSAYDRLAENQAKAGLYADAQASFDNILDNTKTHSRAILLGCLTGVEKRFNEPIGNPTSCICDMYRYP